MSYKVLFLCSKNSARSQIAEAVMNGKADERFMAYSAGSLPAGELHPLALDVLTGAGIDTAGLRPKPMNVYSGVDFDFIITLCDSMRETCPVFPGQPIVAHWGMPDPAEFDGTYDERLRFFKKTLMEITQRILLFMSLPIEKLDRLALEAKVRDIGKTAF